MERLVGPLFEPSSKRSKESITPQREKRFTTIGDDWLLRHGIQRGIEIISEATRRIPPDIQATQPHIPWTQIAGIGNVLRHEYHRISDTIIWNVVKEYLPPLKTAVSVIDASLTEE